MQKSGKYYKCFDMTKSTLQAWQGKYKNTTLNKVKLNTKQKQTLRKTKCLLSLKDTRLEKLAS